MTDLSKFSDENFNAATWINSVVDEAGAEENLESFLNSLSMKLHMAAQDYSEQLETAMIETMSSMPRMMNELTRLEDQLKSVQKEMKSVEESIRKAEDKKALSGLEDLSRLDQLKSNMEKCKSTLEEHARWNQVVREARQLLETGGTLSETADRINSMFLSLDILQNLPGHEDRLNTCQTFRSTLLDALRPNIQQELEHMNLTALKEYYYVFQRLNR
jgi:chromosome segregation ATPase